MQKLVIISGSPCVGKTTAADLLFQSLDNSAFCDGDWLWCVNPFSVEDPRLRNGDKNVSFVLSNYLHSNFTCVILASVVMTDTAIREQILADITAANYEVIGITLTCTEETLAARHKARGDDTECSFYWLRLPPYPGDHVIHTDGKTPQQVADEMKRLIV